MKIVLKSIVVGATLVNIGCVISIGGYLVGAWDLPTFNTGLLLVAFGAAIAGQIQILFEA